MQLYLSVRNQAITAVISTFLTADCCCCRLTKVAALGYIVTGWNFGRKTSELEKKGPYADYFDVLRDNY